MFRLFGKSFGKNKGTGKTRFLMTGLAAFMLAGLLLTGVGCGDDDDSPTDPGETRTHATLNFTLDDATSEIYTAGDGLAWKGNFSYDADNDLLALDPTSSGPFVMLADDGPVSGGGHEPEGAVAGDHLWGASVQVETTDMSSVFTYGVISGSVDGSDGDWIDGNTMQAVTVTSGATGTITAPGLAVEEEVIPSDQAIITFAIDDSANQTYTAGDGLAWKGSFSYDAASRVLTVNGSWPGPYPLLHDDGPLSGGGHEPEGATAGDHVWSVSVLVDNTQQRQLEYGAISGSVNGSDGQWIWSGSNGVLTIPQGTQGPLAAPGLVIDAFGTVDLLLTVDLSDNGSNLAAEFQGADYSASAKVKGSPWGWAELDLVDDGTAGDATSGDGIFSFLLSRNVGAHTGLLESGQVAEFVFVLGGVDYRSSGVCATAGVAGYLDQGSGLVAVTIEVQADGDRNTIVTVP